ncbi:MAG: DNA-3-methyladenine glycosylase I [Gammaproteobacteria bacterium]|nr:DNA-3-methyladenine glycosylase I [Gammaproteobacteria bacterium]MCW5584326.1 DNA-3-methyladenine glycosylase I [Gammaproteobacteria bacterium]
MAIQKKIRCGWVNDDSIYVDYHDREWGVPIYDDNLLFEFLILEGMQAGLNWLTILKKRNNFRSSFNHFDAKKIAKYNQSKTDLLLTDSGIIRNRLKIRAVVTNANAFLKTKEESGSFSDYIWQFTGGKPIQNHWKNHSQVPSSTQLSDKISKDLKKRGFKFVGTTICYAFMQAVGIVNDHTTSCFRYQELKKNK